MFKQRKNLTRKNRAGKGSSENRARAGKINGRLVPDKLELVKSPKLDGNRLMRPILSSGIDRKEEQRNVKQGLVLKSLLASISSRF